MKNIFHELQRRNVFRIGIAYLIAAWLLLQITDVLVPILLLPDWVSRFVFLLLAIGFIPALIFAWAYEMTPEGLRRESDIDPDKSITPQTGRKLDYLIVGILGVAVAVLLADKYLSESPQQAADVAELPATIAVLPFDAMSSNPDDEHFADGLTEELLNSLAKIGELGVVGRTSSFYYKDNPQDLREIGASLQVAHVLEGSVRRDGDQLRITAQLIQTDNGFHRWTETYDRTLDDIFAIQEDIAEQVADALQVAILGREVEALREHGTSDPEAHSRYLIASAYVRRGQAFGLDASQELDDLATARRLLEEAVEIDPEFANAWAMLAVVYHQLSGWGVLDDSGQMLSRDEAGPLAEAAYRNAIELAPELPEAWAAKGFHYSRSHAYIGGDRNDLNEEAEASFEQAMSLDRNNIAVLELYADFSARTGDHAKAVSLYRRATEQDPLSTVKLRLAQALYQSGEPAEAWREYLAVGDLYPNADIDRGIAQMEFDRGHFHHGIALISDELGTPHLIYAWPSLGDIEKGENVLDYFGGQGAEFAQLTAGYRMVLYREFDKLRTEADVAGSMAFIFRWVANIYRRDWDALEDLFPEHANQIYEIRAFFGTFSLQREAGEFWAPFPAVLAYPMAYYGYIKIQTGDTEKAEELMRTALGYADIISQNTPRQVQERHHVRLLVFAARGEKDRALNEFDALVDAGWRWLLSPGYLDYLAYSVDWAWFEDSPLLDSIRDEPRYQQILQRVKDDNARMLAELRAGLSREDVLALGYH